jgi:hypothetical protein
MVYIRRKAIKIAGHFTDGSKQGGLNISGTHVQPGAMFLYPASGLYSFCHFVLFPLLFQASYLLSFRAQARNLFCFLWFGGFEISHLTAFGSR